MKREHSYSEIRLIFFDAATDFCRFHFKNGIVRFWEYNGSEYGFAQDNIPDFKHPLEQLMLIVIITIENAGRHAPTHLWALDKIKSIIHQNTLDTLISNLTPEERQYEDEGIGFLCDLNLVLNNQKLERE